MARQVGVLALIFVAIAGTAMAREAPSESPKSSPSPAPTSSPAPKSSSSSSSPATAPSASSPKASASSPKSSPAPSSSSGEDAGISSPPTEGGPIDLYGAPAPGPAAKNVAPLQKSTPATTDSNGAATLQVSAVVAAAVVAGFFTF